jgi:nicotinate-nucleotide--dimethylbenzimidazole phosphoribosyltransferase
MMDGWSASGRTDPHQTTGSETLDALIASIEPAHAADASAVRARLDELTKPPGSLGRLEDVALRLALLLGDPPPPLRRREVIVFAADHGVAGRGVSAYPQAVTVEMCRTIAAGGAAVCEIARAVDAGLTLVDVGVAGHVAPHPAILSRRIRDGTCDIVETAALTRDEAVRAILAGADTVQQRLSVTDVFAFGELGIGNTTAASALAVALLDLDASEVVGPGTGLDTEGVNWKRSVVRQAVARAAREGIRDPIDLLAQLGGLEIAALVGAILAAAAAARPVSLDGFICTAAAIAAVRMAPPARDVLFAAHRSAEPAHTRLLDALGLEPLLSLGMRLGEGTGAALALPLLEAASGMLRDMSSFTSAGISRRSSGA